VDDPPPPPPTVEWGDITGTVADQTDLGDAATRDVGTTAGTVTAGDDARLSDARTPTAHASSHGDGGADEIAVHASQVTGGTLAVARGGTGLTTSDLTGQAGKTVAVNGAETGYELAAPSGGSIYYPTPSGGYVGMVGRDVDYALPELGLVGRLMLTPMRVPPVPIDRVWVRVTTGAASTWRLGYYPMTSGGLPDWAGVVDAGACDMSGSPGSREATVSATLPSIGWVWGAVLVDAYTALPTVYTSRGNSSGNPPFVGVPQEITPDAYNAIFWAGVTSGALPTSAPAGTVYKSNLSPTMRFRRA
jgi:hypothetical protein